MHRLAAQGLPQAPAQCWYLFLVARGNSVVEVFDGQCIVENIIGISS